MKGEGRLRYIRFPADVPSFRNNNENFRKPDVAYLCGGGGRVKLSDIEVKLLQNMFSELLLSIQTILVAQVDI